jgi:hypothetical protein
VRDPERLLEHLEALAEWREREPQAPRLILVPGRPDPEPGPPARQDVERRRRLHPQARQPVVDAADHQTEPRPFRLRRQEAERRPALEHRILGRPNATDLEEVIHHPDRVEPDLVGLVGDPTERRADGLGAARPGE